MPQSPPLKPPLRIDILSAFPNIFSSVFSRSILKIAVDKGLVVINIHDLREFTSDRRRTIDGRPFGGGPGMILRIEPVAKALEKIVRSTGERTDIYFLSASGKLFDQNLAQKMARKRNLVFVCGHYEGIDERAIKIFGGREISIGNYILSGGEIAAMVTTDAVVRLIPDVLGDRKSLEIESFTLRKSPGRLLLEYPQYTRPRRYAGYSVPHVLLSGDHRKIQIWREKQSLLKTKKNRPDLITKKPG